MTCKPYLNSNITVDIIADTQPAFSVISFIRACAVFLRQWEWTYFQ